MALKSDNVIEIKDQRRKSFFICDNAFVDSLGKLIGPFGHAVYASLLRHANANRTTWPSLSLIAKEWGISRFKLYGV